ncbi:uncharacterized protein F4822DRAFT_423533 [Hypoxylon trugodes]|uniref:uncharacterized protein n=1 Tax=Hypoxylon trugodes TaxID=326681 RepID=UPI00218D2B1A|nr:uncharacterized protein F4822DRAFT_423533 [Hypoxylon trugodes]KAI1382524.1 hypothetical protein F4822DRAFT_423533 [Hypoxylon trugodes]
MAILNENSRIQCFLTLGISPEKASHLLDQLFGVRLDVNGDATSILYKNGVEVLLHRQPLIILQGGCTDTIPSIFGPEIAEGIKESPQFIEGKQERKTSSAVSATISTKVDIHVSLGLIRGTILAEKLFPRKYRTN